LPTAPGWNALAVLCPLSLFQKEQGPATPMTLRRLALFKSSGYQRLLAPAYRLSLARSESFFFKKTFASKGMDEITQSKSKPDLAGSKENLPGQNQVWSLPLTKKTGFVLTWQVWF